MEERLGARLAAVNSATTDISPPAVEPEEDFAAPAGPSEAEEAALISAQPLRGADPDNMHVGVEPVAEVEDATAKLPALGDLVERIPPGVREVMDELFRAKFVRVQRVPKKALHG